MEAITINFHLLTESLLGSEEGRDGHQTMPEPFQQKPHNTNLENTIGNPIITP